MKKLLRTTLAVFLFVTLTEYSFAEVYNFRKTNWGMTKAQVKASETIKLYSSIDGAQLFTDSAIVLRKRVFLIYEFIDNKLIKANYVLNEKHANSNSYIGDHNDFKEILIKKYGNPKRDKEIWKNDVFKGDDSNRGLAINSGHLEYATRWETMETEILLSLHGDNYETMCQVMYLSKKLKGIVPSVKEKEAKEAKEKKAMDSF